MSIRDRILSFIPKDIEDDLSHVDRRWKIKTHKSFPKIRPEYSVIVNPDILYEDQLKSDNYIYVKSRYEAMYAMKSIPSSFNKDLILSRFPIEYMFVFEEIRKNKIIYYYEEPVICSYGGLHWTNLPGLIFVLFEGFSPKSEDFTEIAKIFKDDRNIPIPWKEVHTDRIKQGFKTFLDSISKDPHRYLIRYLVTYREEILRRDGIKFLVPGIEEIMTPQALMDINEMLNERLQIIENSAEYNVSFESYLPPKVRDNIKLPEDRFSINQEENEVIDLGLSTGEGILCYKVVYDSVTDSSRMSPNTQPYVNSAYYDPPITRGVKNLDQPFRFVLANSDIDMDDLDGDTQNMRKVVIGDQLTAMLDWAAKNGKTLPELGTEFYIHIGDSVTENISQSRMPMAAYSRKKRDSSFIMPFPDYSYQVFSINTRFHIRESTSMTWNYIRDYIIGKSKEILPDKLKDRDPTIFFRGNEFDYIGIRKSLYHLQRNDIKYGNNVILKKGDLKIEIPKLSDGDLKPMDVSEMGKYAILLDLPGYGMWSTRLKLVCLTGSYVPRIMFLERTWNKEKKIWEESNPKEDLWETFTDSYLPTDFTHTIIGNYFKGTFSKDSEQAKEIFSKNNQNKLKVLEKVSIIKNHIREPKYQNKADQIFKRVSSLTEDHINEYIYEIVMKQSRYYGFTK